MPGDGAIIFRDVWSRRSQALLRCPSLPPGRTSASSPARECRTSSGRFAARPRRFTPTWAARPRGSMVETPFG
jgi:hypothetical protein